MFDSRSRYALIETADYVAADGRSIRYVRRRFLPRRGALIVGAEATVTGGDRLDLLAARTLGDAEQYWRIGDANPSTLNPFELMAPVGRVLSIPTPGVTVS